jgi:hypothetical protein
MTSDYTVWSHEQNKMVLNKSRIFIKQSIDKKSTQYTQFDITMRIQQGNVFIDNKNTTAHTMHSLYSQFCQHALKDKFLHVKNGH